MRASRRNEQAEIKRRSRSTKDDADTQGIGHPAEGIRLPVPSYTEDDQASFLGVDEPVVEREDQGASAPSDPLPTRPNTPSSST